MQLSLYPPEIGLDVRWHKYQTTEYYKLRQSLPIKELAALLPTKKSVQGAPAWFDNEARIAIQFLKPYLGCSDEKLLEHINTNFAIQFFLGINLKYNERIKDKNLIWQTRTLVADHLDICKFQPLLIAYWKPDLRDTRIGLSDATCYESYIKYPTDAKLLWDCCEYLHKTIKWICSEVGLRKPRNKMKDQRMKQSAFNKRKKKTYKLRQRRRRALLYLLNKLLLQYLEVAMQAEQQEIPITGMLDKYSLDKIACIEKVYEQQRWMHEYPGQYVADRIVSLYKPYLRPIVRGKENKRVEFGAKLNTWQVDGLNFIEYFSFKAFHEGNRLKDGIVFHHQHFGKLRHLGADAIYATNPNRRFCKRFNIGTNFKPKGRKKADKDICRQEQHLRKLISKQRATVLEGAYGNDKNHYGLRKIKARNEKTEVLWIFFGMMCANAMKIVKRKAKAPPHLARAA